MNINQIKLLQEDLISLRGKPKASVDFFKLCLYRNAKELLELALAQLTSQSDRINMLVALNQAREFIQDAPESSYQEIILNNIDIALKENA